MVTGDAVNTASRLEAVAAPGQVIASERTVRAVRGFRVEDMGALDLKGKARRVHAFCVLDETTTLPERGVPGLRAPLVGRDDEIDLLESIYGRVASEGRPHLPEGDSEERVRLQSIRASWPFAFPDPPMSEQEALDCERIGLEAAEMALRLGMYDLASGAFDAASGFGISRGLYARVSKIQQQRLEILPHVGDLVEISDVHSMIAWGDHELGRYQEGLTQAEEGVRLVEGTAANMAIHAASWQVVLEYRLGAWDRALATFERVTRCSTTAATTPRTSRHTRSPR